MRTNPAVCFEVDSMNNMANWKSVIAWGTFEELTETKERENALNLLLRRPLPLISSEKTHLGKEWPFSKNDASDIEGIFYRIKLSEKTGRFETNSISSALAM